MTTVRSRRREGDVVEIALSGGHRAFGRVLHEPLVEFWSLCAAAEEHVSLARLRQADVAFRIWVMNAAITSGRWRVIYSWPLDDDERHRREVFFKQDVATGRISTYWTDPVTGSVHEDPSTYDEVTGLECAAVWSAEHVEERLSAMCAGTPSRIAEMLRPQPESTP